MKDVSRKIVISIDRMALGGEGVGHLPASSSGLGKVVFVPYGAPGDHAIVEVISHRKTYSRARLLGLRQASPQRIQPPCPYFFQGAYDRPWCGGCDWQHLSQTTQLHSKKKMLTEVLERIGGFERPIVEDTLALAEPWRYRHKVQVPFRRLHGKPAFGFYAPGSHTLVEFDDCLIQPEASSRILRTLRHCAHEEDWSAYDEDRGSGWLRHVTLRLNEKGEVLVTFVTRDSSFPHPKAFCERLRTAHPEVVGIHQNINPERTHRILGREWRNLWGKDFLLYQVGPVTLQASPASFFQVNEAVALLLCETVNRFLGDGTWDILLDLYCGVGLFGLFLARKARKVIGVDEVPQAIRDARANQERNRIHHANFQVAHLERGLSARLRGLKTVAVVDPPRSGLTPQLIRILETLCLQPLIYVSCDPATLARDLRTLCQKTYVLQKVRPLDLFPQTPHIESVALLVPKT